MFFLNEMQAVSCHNHSTSLLLAELMKILVYLMADLDV
jgi:hypothetical protein